MRSPRVTALILAGVFCASPVVAHAAPDPAPGSPAWQAAEVLNRAETEGRGRDQLANPAYLRATAPLIADYLARKGDGILYDPFRKGWSGTRGQRLDVSFPNRYGVRLVGHLYRRGPGTHRHPGVVLVPGYGDYDDEYEALAEELAEAGYVVLGFTPQGQGLSDARPAAQYCDPNGAWRRPQEGGLTETGPCAGVDGPLPDDQAGLGDPVTADLAYRRDPEEFTHYEQGYRVWRPRFVFGAIDAARYLVSAANPWRDMVDPKRIAVVGHSAGADAALVAAQVDRRFKAAVAWDTYGTPPASIRFRAPTMIQQSEQEAIFGPWTAPPPKNLFPSSELRDRFTAAGVDNALVVLRSSTHSEWRYSPYATSVNPIVPFLPASALGQQIAAYYTLAWLDRYLAPARREGATTRLTARRFDGSVDRFNVSQGTYDARHDANAPYRLQGLAVRDHLSMLFPSSSRLDGHVVDLRGPS